MRYGTDNEPAFDTDNRAWRRFSDVAAEHFDAITWTRAEDDRPVMITVRDLQTGDMFTLAVIDSLEVRDPHVLVAVSTGGDLAAHGPTEGAEPAAAYGAALALGTAALAATRAAPLHDPATAALPAAAWVDVPPGLAPILRPAPDDARAAVLVLLDRTGGRLAAIGPFPNHATADAWRPDSDPAGTADRLIVPLHPVTLEEQRS